VASRARPVLLPIIGSPLYWVSRWLVEALVRRFLRLEVDGIENFPRSGGVLVVSNHVSIADPPLLALVAPRPVSFMGKTELFRNRFRSWLFRSWGVFPVRRGEIDVGAVRTALHLLHEGTPVVIFPEGTRRPTELGEGLPGIGYFAARSACPVLPVGIVGTEGIRHLLDIRHRSHINVRFGKTFMVPKGSAEAGAELIMQNIAALLPPERRGRYDSTDPAALAQTSSAPRRP
jgi:1-acyl-sn-glycerol-3-phosphate acyltransferase